MYDRLQLLRRKLFNFSNFDKSGNRQCLELKRFLDALWDHKHGCQKLGLSGCSPYHSYLGNSVRSSLEIPFMSRSSKSFKYTKFLGNYARFMQTFNEANSYYSLEKREKRKKVHKMFCMMSKD